MDTEAPKESVLPNDRLFQMMQLRRVLPGSIPTMAEELEAKVELVSATVDVETRMAPPAPLVPDPPDRTLQ